jgi:hypothetical protein
MTRGRLSLVSGAVGLLSAVAFVAVGPESEDPVRTQSSGVTLRDTMPGPPLAELPYVRARELTDSLVLVQRFAATAPLSDHRPLSDRLGP